MLREWEYFPLDELPQSQTPQTWDGTAVTQGCWTPLCWSAHPLGPKAHVGMVAGPLSLAEPCHGCSTPKPSAKAAWDTHVAVQPCSLLPRGTAHCEVQRKGVDAGFALHLSITRRGGWDLMWGERETPQVTCFCSSDQCHSTGASGGPPAATTTEPT